MIALPFPTPNSISPLRICHHPPPFLLGYYVSKICLFQKSKQKTDKQYTYILYTKLVLELFRSVKRRFLAKSVTKTGDGSDRSPAGPLLRHIVIVSRAHHWPLSPSVPTVPVRLCSSSSVTVSVVTSAMVTVQHTVGGPRTAQCHPFDHDGLCRWLRWFHGGGAGAARGGSAALGGRSRRVHAASPVIPLKVKGHNMYRNKHRNRSQ